MLFLDHLKFITQGGSLSVTVAVLLLAMSLGSWTIVLIKALQLIRLKRRSQQFVSDFWQQPSLNHHRDGDKQNTPFARLTAQGHVALRHYASHAKQRQHEGRNLDDFVAHVLRRALNQEAVKLENGLTLLASVGSLSPFIGLFGTVWGIYHALGTIALQGQTKVNDIAGPVGEALIMTAFGLAVAIPAVLAYNTLVRYNRLWIEELESFAHDLHTYLTTGVPMPHELTGKAISAAQAQQTAVQP